MWESAGVGPLVHSNVTKQDQYRLFSGHTVLHPQYPTEAPVQTFNPVGGIDHGLDPVVKAQVVRASSKSHA